LVWQLSISVCNKIPAICTLRFGSSSTHWVYRVGVECPRLWLENMVHGRSRGWEFAFHSWLRTKPARHDGWMSNGSGQWATFLSPVEHGNNLCVLSSLRVVIGVPQWKATSVKAWQKVWENSSERRTSFMTLDDLFWKCIRRSSYTGTERIPNNGQFLTTTTTSYTSLYFILDKYHYSKVPSPGVNDCFVSCMFFGIDLKIILILIQPQERNLWSQPSKSFIITMLILEMDILMTKC